MANYGVPSEVSSVIFATPPFPPFNLFMRLLAPQTVLPKQKGVLATAALMFVSGVLCVLWDLQVKKRADERTRTADLVSLLVCGQWLLSVAGVCKSRIDNGFCVLSIAHYCRLLRPG